MNEIVSSQAAKQPKLDLCVLGEIQKIVKSISELSAIFRELSVLVIDSGTILDRIDYNMEVAVDNFEAAEVCSSWRVPGKNMGMHRWSSRQQ